MKTLLSMIAFAILGSSFAAHSSPSSETVSSPRLYTIDCGSLDVDDYGSFSDAGHFNGQKGTIVVPCYLIQHSKGWLLWDAGMADFFRWVPGGFHKGPYVFHVDKGLLPQLKKFGLLPEQIDYLAFSHLHFDHTGNARKFTKATWIVPPHEAKWAQQDPTPPGVFSYTIKHLDEVKRIDPGQDFDVFKDGTVRVLATPGHTPGHSSLLVTLQNSGQVLLVGDLWHLKESRTHKSVPIYNTSREQTLASMEDIERRVAAGNIRVVIAHANEDFAAMPVFPNYLD